MSSMGVCEGGPRMEIWAGSSTDAPGTRRRGRGNGSFPASANLDHPITDKENVINPSGPSNRRCVSSVPSWHPRYPLQDVTLLMHFLQGMQLDEDSSLAASSGRSTGVEARKKRSDLPVPRSNNSTSIARSSSSLRMSFR